VSSLRIVPFDLPANDRCYRSDPSAGTPTASAATSATPAVSDQVEPTTKYSDNHLHVILPVVVGVMVLLCVAVLLFIKRVSSRHDRKQTEPALACSTSSGSMDEATLHTEAKTMMESAGPGFGFEGLSKDEWKDIRLGEGRPRGCDRWSTSTMGGSAGIAAPGAARLKELSPLSPLQLPLYAPL
jgi:hypothetical protein